ncbi:MAG TPA: ABC transporter permease [Candidatus Thiothrix moscowensis]|uniref:ABC transporter permease n=1 Tax=unclassified Thiothrix TaxID=2636184 RepID=UPI0025D0BB06|nr:MULTISPECIES: ABC transporter permease [unclassified Thiothrix]HRJ54157.1 ABC transporter permease [Candidatus Thiothrix moscowensis]HRJ94351.1 ABC transporter permease [Candidatus Thiothrix moscowensis]
MTKPYLVIEAGKTEQRYWQDIWNYRELLYFLAWRDILVRYKQTVIGIAWAVIRPVLTMIVFSIIFGKIANLPSGEAPYPIMVFAALLPWTFFATALNDAGNSLITNSNLISKVYFPRLLIPVSAIGVCLVDLLLSLIILCLLMFAYQHSPPWQVIFLPFFIFLAISVSLGLSIFLAALNVTYRDFRHIIPFIIQLGLFLSPVGFTSSIIPEQWKYLYALNPMVGVIDGFRWAILGGDHKIDPINISISIGITAILLIFGIKYFRMTEKKFADVI